MCVYVCVCGIWHTYIDNSVRCSEQVFVSVAKGFQQKQQRSKTKIGQKIKSSLKNTLNTFSFHVGAHNSKYIVHVGVVTHTYIYWSNYTQVKEKETEIETVGCS